MKALLLLQASLVTYGPLWVNSAATFHVTIDLWPGVTSMNMETKCSDPSAAYPLPPTLQEDESGWLSRFYPLSKTVPFTSDKRYKISATGAYETSYFDITNSHPTENVTVTVVAAVVAVTAGTHSCSLELKSGPSSVNLTFEAVAAVSSLPILS